MNIDYKVWHGKIATYIDHIEVAAYKNTYTGCFGGSSQSGTVDNEDGYLVACPTDDSTLAVLFDAHTSKESLLYVMDQLTLHMKDISACCQGPVEQALPRVQAYITSFIQETHIKDKCKSLTGETALLFCLQKQEYLWWLSIGDNSLYVFHDDFNDLGQYQVNSRIYYQWIGQQNALDLKVPCFASGTLQLRQGVNKILLLTDGVLEIEGRPFEDSKVLKACFEDTHPRALTRILEEVQKRKGRDNATLISWQVTCNHRPLRPSRL